MRTAPPGRGLWKLVGRTLDEFRRRGHELIDWIADARAGLASRPVLAPTVPGEVQRQLPAAPPQQPEDWAAIQRDLDAVIVPALTHWQHPRFFAYFPSNASLASVLGDIAAAHTVNEHVSIAEVVTCARIYRDILGGDPKQPCAENQD